MTTNLAERFKKRALELAREGKLGALRTRKATLQVAYGNLVSLIDENSVNTLIYGEEGSGKKRLVEEYMVLQNFYLRIANRKEGRLKVMSALFLQSGFAQVLEAHEMEASDIIYIERVDLLTAACQKELAKYLKARTGRAQGGQPVARLIFGTEKALSLMMLKKEFDRELFQTMTQFAIFLPSLNERAEDLPELVAGLIENIAGQRAVPSSRIIDIFAKQLWAKNFEDLKKVLKNMLAKNRTVSQWTEEDLPMDFRSPQRFVRTSPPDFTQVQKDRTYLRQALYKAGGDRERAAKQLGVSKVDLLQRLLVTGLR